VKRAYHPYNRDSFDKLSDSSSDLPDQHLNFSSRVLLPSDRQSGGDPVLAAGLVMNNLILAGMHDFEIMADIIPFR
jgi:hypothetical protein